MHPLIFIAFASRTRWQSHWLTLLCTRSSQRDASDFRVGVSWEIITRPAQETLSELFDRRASEVINYAMKQGHLERQTIRTVIVDGARYIVIRD
jgi:hypothetical protein